MKKIKLENIRTKSYQSTIDRLGEWADTCIVCGQRIAMKGDIQYTTSGFLIDEREEVEDTQGFFPIGAECLKKFNRLAAEEEPIVKNVLTHAELKELEKQTLMNIEEKPLNKLVFVLTLRTYSGDGIHLKTRFENLGIFTSIEKALTMAYEGGYYNAYRASVLLTSVELDRLVSF